MREVLQWLLAMRWRLALVVAGLVVWQVTTPLANGLLVFHCLAKSPRQALQTAAIAAALLGLLLLLSGSPVWIAAVVLFSWMLIVGIGAIVQRFDSLNIALQLISVISIATLLVWGLLAPEPSEAFREFIDTQLVPVMEQAQIQWEPGGLEKMLVLMPAIFVGSAFLGLLVSVVLGRYWQSLVMAPGRFGDEFRRFRLGLIAGVPATLGLVAGLIWAWPPLVNVALICGLVFCIQGLAVAHAMAAKFGSGKTPLVVMYVLLAMVPQILAPLISTVGLVDNWFDLRKRVEPKK